MKIKKPNYNSLTPWDNKSDLTAVQSSIKSAKKELYKLVHQPLFNSNEKDVFNAKNIVVCPYCNSNKIIKYGKSKNEVQRYFCKCCKKSFSSTTATIIDHHKIALESRIKFLLDLFTQSSTLTCSKTSNISYNTAKKWLKDVFFVLKSVQDNTVLVGENIQIDELYLSVNRKNLKRKNNRIIGTKTKHKLCIALGVDNEKIVAIYEGEGNTNKDKTRSALGDKIMRFSTIHHDNEKAHNILIENLQLYDVKYDWKKVRETTSDENLMMPIIRLKMTLTRFLEAHHDFNIEEIQDYLNLFCFIMNKPYDYLEKVEIILNKMVLNEGTLKNNEKSINMIKND